MTLQPSIFYAPRGSCLTQSRGQTCDPGIRLSIIHPSNERVSLKIEDPPLGLSSIHTCEVLRLYWICAPVTPR
jgi:hypothetical protein